MPSPASILKETFGYDEFLPYQREIIENVLAGKDTLAIMPAIAGKCINDERRGTGKIASLRANFPERCFELLSETRHSGENKAERSREKRQGQALYDCGRDVQRWGFYRKHLEAVPSSIKYDPD